MAIFPRIAYPADIINDAQGLIQRTGSQLYRGGGIVRRVLVPLRNSRGHQNKAIDD
jgi:hypothetical protein